MAKRTVKLVGGNELKRALKKLPDDYRRVELDEIVQDVASLMVREARARVPVRTGRLRRSIGRAPIRDLSTSNAVVWAVGPDAANTASRREGFYGLFLEKGTKDRKRGAKGFKARGAIRSGSRAFTVAQTGGGRGRAPALRWLSKAFRSARKKMLREFEQQSKKAIERIARRNARGAS